MIKESKSEIIVIRISKSEKDKIKDLAEQNNMSVSDYMRIVSLKSKISVEMK